MIQPTTITQGNNNLVLSQNGTGKFGIGTTTPGNKVEIMSGSAGQSGLRFTDLTSASTGSQAVAKPLGVDANGDVVVVTSATRPYFRAVSAPVSNNGAPTTNIVNFTESADDTNAFDPATGFFTAAEAGYYQFSYTMVTLPTASGYLVQGIKVYPANGSPIISIGGDQRYSPQIPGDTGLGGKQIMSGSAFVRLQAGDRVAIWAGMNGYGGPDTFSIELSGIKL